MLALVGSLPRQFEQRIESTSEILQPRCSKKVQTQIFKVFIQVLTALLHVANLPLCVLVLVLYAYACGSQRGVDRTHNPSQNPEGSSVINVQSLGGSPPPGLCPAGCSRGLTRPGGLPGLS